ncbi:hypothetical protein [uncultured Ruminococcus sp.]|uniref:hypothetical protein n=1 Tax=uncultured Ruminococcus sp. TaxID=165186 RepID=UPI0025F138DA|nr:hypothetical protein [uncultured Ruminococcus sp.]
MMQTAKGTVKQHVALDGVPILDQIRSTVSVGKACVVVFAERDISAVRYAEFALPSASRHHSLSDGIIIGTIDGSGTVIPGESSAPLPSETATAKTSTNKKANGTEIQVDVKVSRQSGNKLQAKSDGLFVPESPDTNTTYNISKDGSTLKLIGSDGSESSVAIPENKNTTYRVSSGIFPSSHGVTLRGSDGSNSIAPLETYRRSLYLPDATAKNMNRVTERGYLFSTHGYAFKLTMSRYDSSHNFEMDGTYVKDGVEYDFIIRGDISVKQDATTISNLSIECNDPDNQLSVYAYNIFEPATETTDYVYYCAWIALYSNKDLSDWSCRVLVSIHYTDGEYIEPSTPPDSEHSVDYVKMAEQMVKTSDTTYELAQYKDLHDTVPNGPIVSLKDSTGAFTDAVVPCAMTCSSWDAVYKEYYGNIPGNNRYASLLDIVYQDSSDYILPVIIDTHLIVKYGAVQYDCRVKIYHATDPNNYTYAEVFPPPILSSPKIKWTVLTFRVPSNYVFYRICIDQTTMQNIFDSTGAARLLFVTSEDGKLLSQAQRTAELDAYLDEYYGEPVTTYTTLSSRNAPDVAFTGDYNDLSNKPTIPDISGKQDKSTAVTHTANTAVGSATKPVYVAADGKAAAISHSINSDVPANAKFTDTVYTHPTTSGNKHIPSGGSSGQILRWSADGTAVWGANLPTTNVGSGSQPQEFRLAATISIKTWSHYHGVYAIGSRHSGTGILVVDVGCENSSVSFANVAAQCICFGASLNNRIQSNTFQIYVSDDGSKAYLFIKNWDYSVCTIKSLRTDGITISNGLAMASIDTSTYGTLKCQTTICGVTFSGTAAKANALVESVWTAVPTTGASATVYNSLKYLKSGNTVYVQGAIGFKAGLNAPTCGTMPSGCLPDIELCFTGWDYASGVPAAYPIKLGTNGVITLLNPTSTAYWFKAGRLYHFNFCYHIG